IIADYRLANQSRLASILGRREVLTGKAKFGIFGDGKEVAQLAMAKAFQYGDWRAGYYRDQTFMFATGTSDLQKFFAQLYAHADPNADPASAGRMMNAHFSTRSLHADGSFRDLMKLKNSSPDFSPTAAQMPRLVGLAYASKLYRDNPGLHEMTQFSDHGNEVAFGTIGNASTSEGLFFEAFNAAGVLKIPMIISVWDDEYGISVPAEYQTTKKSISKVLAGFEAEPGEDGYLFYVVKGWDYHALCDAYLSGVPKVRETHTPALYHITEMTQPQGHSTSGSQERYKSKERLTWEAEYDCNRKMREWMIANHVITESALSQLEKEDKEVVDEAKRRAFEAFMHPIKQDIAYLGPLLNDLSSQCSLGSEVAEITKELESAAEPLNRDVVSGVRKALRLANIEQASSKAKLNEWLIARLEKAEDEYSSCLYSGSADAALKVPEIKPVYSEKSQEMNGSQIMVNCFDAAFSRDPRIFAIGEDIGKIGDVNKGMDGLQEKFGEIRITDTGIREATILGQAIGAAMRGLKP
ncbi:MAG: thiamine pyrophosphate-dependent enzyme, partial [Candidatus Kapaibacterium sp.]